MVQLRPTQKQAYRRDAWLEINLDNLEFNLKKIYAEFNKPLIPVLKADAYGHGAAIIVKVLDAYPFIEAYAVASIDEALSLRETTAKRIVVLGISPDWALERALSEQIEITIVDLAAAIKLDELAGQQGLKAQVHIKFDTGMNRIGFKSKKDIAAIEALENLEIKSVYTHFADAANKDLCIKQYQLFKQLSEGMGYPMHPASSQALRALGEQVDFDYVRCGIELYGLENPELKPLLSLFARISFIKEIEAGESVSYKATWTASEATKIATLPLGYADGVPRSLSNNIVGRLKPETVKQVGLITMDQMMFDIGSIDAQTGDLVELLGDDLPVSDWACGAGSISYEIVSALSLRLPKTYTRK
ncbi:MAG: alanine racemase [Cyanobacteria bacterium]|nr:alanine racemase [Cyanobacteriota bacterium]